jgi:putative addiction module component (TIGR02574 family)
METELEKLVVEVLKLAPGERAVLAQLLLNSLGDDDESGEEIDEAWAVEVDRRIAELDAGEVKGIPIAEALAQVRATLK